MENKARTDNPLANIYQFYIDQAEQMAPILKQGIEDWFTIYNKLWTESMKLQREWIQQWTNIAANTEFTDKAKEFGEKVIETQKEVSTGMVDVAMKGVETLKDKPKKGKG